MLKQNTDNEGSCNYTDRLTHAGPKQQTKSEEGTGGLHRQN